MRSAAWKYIPFSGADLKLAACAFHIHFFFPPSSTAFWEHIINAK
jgi:hypothetical protein